MASRSFSSKQALKAHLVRGSGGWQGEIADLRADTEEGFQAAEADVGGGLGVAQANIRLNTQPTAADTLTIGSDVYEFVATLGSQTAGHIGVLRGASAAAARANIVSAINGTAGLGTTYSAKGTSAVKATIYNSDFLHIEAAEAAGGAVVPGLKPSIALSDGLTAVIAWDHENLGRTGGNVSLKKVMHQVIVDAVNLAADFDVVAPGVITKAEVLYVTDASDVVDTTGKAASIVLTVVAARNAVTVDFNSGGTDPVATDKVYLQITYV
jgi:hypothetical protein